MAFSFPAVALTAGRNQRRLLGREPGWIGVGGEQVAAGDEVGDDPVAPGDAKTTFGGGGCGRDSPESGLELTDGKARHEVARATLAASSPADNNAAREAKRLLQSRTVVYGRPFAREIRPAVDPVAMSATASPMTSTGSRRPTATRSGSRACELRHDLQIARRMRRRTSEEPTSTGGGTSPRTPSPRHRPDSSAGGLRDRRPQRRTRVPSAWCAIRLSSGYRPFCAPPCSLARTVKREGCVAPVVERDPHRCAEPSSSQSPRLKSSPKIRAGAPTVVLR